MFFIILSSIHRLKTSGVIYFTVICNSWYVWFQCHSTILGENVTMFWNSQIQNLLLWVGFLLIYQQIQRKTLLLKVKIYATRFNFQQEYQQHTSPFAKGPKNDQILMLLYPFHSRFLSRKFNICFIQYHQYRKIKNLQQGFFTDDTAWNV